MTCLFYMIPVHGQIYPSIVSPSISFLSLLVFDESIDESLLVLAGACTIILQALRLPILNFFDV